MTYSDKRAERAAQETAMYWKLRSEAAAIVRNSIQPERMADIVDEFEVLEMYAENPCIKRKCAEFIASQRAARQDEGKHKVRAP